MRLAVGLLFLLLAATAHAREAALPVPPIPPPRPPPMAAPVPDLDMPVPYSEAWRSPVTLYTDINHRASPSVGAGYAPGARYQLDNDRHWITLPGFMVHIPFP
jgi:hypothetical protein